MEVVRSGRIVAGPKIESICIVPIISVSYTSSIEDVIILH